MKQATTAPRAPAELLFRHADGSPFKVEYFGNPEASEKKCRDGWLRMGDIVRQDENGWLYFEYRAGGGIRHNGEFVNPAAVEKAIAECELIDDVFVYGIKAASGAPGEKDVVAAIIPKNRSTFDPREVFRVCRSQLEPSAIPTYLQLVPEIPKTASEKPQERFLIELFERQREDVYTERP